MTSRTATVNSVVEWRRKPLLTRWRWATSKFWRHSVVVHLLALWFPTYLHLSSFLPRDSMTARYMLSLCVRMFVRPSVCLSQAGTVSKRLNAGSRKQRRTIAHGWQIISERGVVRSREPFKFWWAPTVYLVKFCRRIGCAKSQHTGHKWL